MNSLLRKVLKKFAGPGKHLLRLMTKAEYRILSLFSPDERARNTQQQIDILLGQQTHLPIAQANALNKGLFADIYAIPEHEWVEFEEHVRAFCRERSFLPDYTEAIFSHRYRYYLTIKWLQSIVGLNPTIIALELGGEEVATDFLRDKFPHVQWQNTHGDLRYRWKNIANESLDLIVGMEIVEHLADLPDGFNHGFFRTGLKALLAEAYRVLKADGVLFITTPNAGSIVHLESALNGASPWFFSLHNREYTIYELQDELAQAGFTIKRWQAVHCMTIDSCKDHTQIFQLLLSRSYQTANRGDDLFIIAGK
jgi:predicted SAM-dependent methyltransferase